MAGDVHQRVAVGDDLDALLDQPVEHAADRLLVAGDHAGGIDQAVAARELDVGMLVLGDAGERRARLALAAGAERHHFLRRQRGESVGAAELGQPVEIAKLARDLHDAVHGAADHDHLAPGGDRAFRHAAQTPGIGGEGGDRHAPRRGLDQRGNCLGDLGFRGRAALAHRIGRIADQRQAAFLAESAQLGLTGKTCTWHIGFLPQRSASRPRTARRTASATASGSRRRPRGRDLKHSMMASCTASCRKPPSRSRSGMPIRSYSGSAASRPSSVSASATDTAPAKLKRRRSATVRASAGTRTDPSL